MRIGIATGLVVVGDMIGSAALKSPSSRDAEPRRRLQALAEPDASSSTRPTRRKVGGLSRLADLGPQTLKGFADSPRRLAGDRRGRVTNRSQPCAGGPGTDVGRDAEIELLMRHLERARQATGAPC